MLELPIRETLYRRALAIPYDAKQYDTVTVVIVVVVRQLQPYDDGAWNKTLPLLLSLYNDDDRRLESHDRIPRDVAAGGGDDTGGGFAA